MECKAYIKELSRDIRTNGLNLLVTLEDADLRYFEKVTFDTALRLRLTKWSEKRSLNANAYFHVLVGKIADEIKAPKPYVKNILIGRYGQMEMIEGQPVFFKTNLPDSVMLNREDIHCMPTKREDKATYYKVYRGTHTYTQDEMKVLIDGTVQEAKDLGIETATPDELKEMLGAWNYEKHIAEE